MSVIFKMAAKTRYKKWAVKIQHCPISSKFDMWVDNDVPNWFPTLKNFYWSPFSKWPPQYCTNSTMSDFNAIHMWVSGNVEFLASIFYTVFWQPFWKWQTSRKFSKCRSAPLMVTYHYVKFNVSIIIKSPKQRLETYCFCPVSYYYQVDAKNSTLPDIIKIWYVGR
jgi:hypothetical protein